MANLSNQTNTVGTTADDSITGTAGNDTLGGGLGNDTLTGALGNDVIDGGAGINTYIIQGNADAFTRRVVYDSVTATTSWQITDLVVGGLDPLNASDEGVDTLKNIQKLQFVLPDGTLDSEVVIDDFANSASAANQEIQYGNWVNGRLNFYGDTDWLRVSETAGQKYVVFVGSGTNSTYYDDRYISGNYQLDYTPATTQVRDIQIFSPWMSSTAPNNSSPFSLILRRELDGTTASETLNADTGYEYLVGGAGDDTLNGSARSDYLSGGDGNDVLTGGAGSDELDGGTGIANVAVFSGNKASYSFQWAGSSDLGLKVSHLNGGADGIDTLKNVQILRFADGDVVLDAQGSDPFGLLPNNIGQAMVGSLPGTGNNPQQVDFDAFAQKFSGLTTNSTLRVKLVTSGESGYVDTQFKLIGTQDVLTFANATNPSQTYTDFNYNNVQQWDDSGNRTWFVTPQYWGSGQQAFAGDRADVSVSGYAYGDFGTFLNYSITVDRVQLGTANAEGITGDGVSTYIDAQAGNDTVTGSALGEEIQGGAGDDLLNGGLGNDILVGGAGTNTLNGGEGDDTLDVRQSTSGTNGVSDSADGGAGVDTLLINASQNIANMTVTNVEVLQADGGVSALTPAAVLAKGFTTANNITFRLDPALANGGTLDASGLSGTLSLRGTNQSDTLIGNDQANTIYLQSDTRTGSGLGADTVVAGAGDDAIVWGTESHQQWSSFFSGVDVASRTYQIKGSLDGGAGNDKLVLHFDNSGQDTTNSNDYWYHAWFPEPGRQGNTWDEQWSPSWRLDLSGLTLTGVEELNVVGYNSSRSWAYPSEFLLTASQVSSLATLSGIPALGIVGGGAVDLNQLAALGISNWRIADASAYTITGTASSDSIEVGAGATQVNAGDGNDTITINSKASVTDTLDGGAGNDVLRVSGSDVDLSGATLTNIESIQVSSTSLSLTAAQWASFSNISRVAGANTAYILSVPTAGTTSMAADSAYVGLTGSAGDDHLIGNASNNILVGGDGSDVLTGNAGNDRLVSGAGLDWLSGGDGDDVLVITGKATSRDSYDGGAGADTLQVTSSIDLTGATITGMELLDGTGTVTMSLTQLAGFTEVRGVTVQLSGTSTELNLGATRLGAGASVLMPLVDPTLAITTGILGSKGDDIISGSAGADVIYGGRGADRLDGGVGADTLIGGSGVDTLIGGAGDDVFRVESSELATGNATVYSDIIDGGLGSDSLEINFIGSSAAWQTYRLNSGAVANVERLVVNNAYFSTVALTADNWNALTSFVGGVDQTTPYYMPWLAITGAGSSINFNAVDVRSNIGKLELNGSFSDIDVSNITLGQTANITYDTALNYHRISVSNFDSILLSGGNDLLVVNSDTSFTVNAGAGDDTIKVNVSGNLAVTIDGGAGTDTLDLSNSGFVDLTQSTITNIESIKHGTSTLVVTEAQLAAWSFDGSGAKFTKVGSAIVGTASADSYSGNGSGSFQGGGGNDSISNVNTAVFTGNYADYDFVRSGSTLTVQQARGSLADGTDTLSGVMNAKFADTTVVLDDAPDSFSFGMMGGASGNWNDLTHADYDKRVSARKDFGSDVDIFSATLAPNSPLAIAASSEKGSNWTIGFTDVATNQQLQFKSLVNGQIQWGYNNWMSATDKWLPGFNTSDGFKPYQGGDVVLQYNLQGTDIQNYAFTLSYLDDYAGSVDTQGQMNALVGEVRGYIGDIADADWIRTDLIAGTKYEFNLKGLASNSGSLIDPKLQLLDAHGNLVETGLDLQANTVGGDDTLIFRPTASGTYYLSAADVGGIAKGSWTLTQKSLDTIAGNTTTTERVEWNGGQQFSVSSEINALSDHDWFKVWLDRGLTYSFRDLGTSGGGGTLTDPQLSLRSVTGILLAQDDNNGGGSDAKLIYRPTDSGWYYLDAGASGNAGKGTYTLSGSTLADDFGNNIQTNGVVQVGTPVQGLISYNGDSDWLKTGLTKGHMYVIDAVGDTSDTAQLDPLVDPLIIIRDAAGNQVFKADDFGGTLDARAYFTPDADGLYFIEVKSAFRFDTGAYQVSVGSAPADDFSNTVAQAVATPANAGVLGLGTPTVGVLGVPGDHDVFSVSLEAGRMYQLGAQGLASHNGTLADPYLRVFDAAGHLLDFANNGGTGTDAMLYFAPTVTGTYYLEALANDERGMGTYQVSAVQRDLPPDDVPNNLSTGVTLTAGDSFAGQLLTHNDQDWFRIALAGQQDYVFRVRASESGYGSLQDPVLEIRAGDGSLVQTIDNGVISHEPAVSYTPSSSGTYYLVVKAADGQTDTGSYTLMTRAPDDHSDTQPGATALARDVATDGAIQWSYGAFGVRAYDSIGIATDADEDWFQFTAGANEVLSVVVTPTTGSALSRPLVEVVDASGRMAAIGDGLETNNGSATATFKAGAAGTYYARVIDGAGATGAYSVRVSAGDASDEDAAGAVNLSFTSNGVVTKAESVGKIGLAGDVDQFTADLQAGHQYRFETMAVRDGTQAPISSAALTLSFTPTGAAAEAVSAVQGVAEPSLFDTASFTATSSGRMSVTVNALDATQTGQYKLRVVDLGGSSTDDRPDVKGDYVDATHGVLAVNEGAQGQINSTGDTDLFAINLTSGNLYDFSVKGFGDGLGTLAQPALRLLDANGALVTVGSFDGSTGRADMAVSVFEDGLYYLAVAATDAPGNIGTYQLDTRLRDSANSGTDDISGDTRSGASVRPGAPVAGTINYADDQDWISANLVAGKVYVADVLADGAGSSGVVGGTLKDATLRLLDATGAELMHDDNSGAALDSRLLITPTADGTYYFDVGANGAELGTYTLRLRELYSGEADPLQSAQWYLPALGLDKLNGQITGAGITVGMVDDGIDTAHPDLINRIDIARSFDTVYDTQGGGNKIPYPTIPTGDFHGTAVAGIIVGEQNNQTGIVGIAPDAQIVSTRVKWTWEQITQALGQQYQFDISNNSWGAINPFSDNFNSTALTFAYEALRKGVEDGRQGLGTVFVFSAGNSAGAADNTNYHNFQNAREVITVAAANQDGSVASFSTPGSSVLVGAYGVDLLTTDRHESGLGLNTSSNYTTFTGTSAAAPVVSGVAALMLEVNPLLGYRDVQEILALSASHPDSMAWKTNGASDWNLGGMLFNDQLGFGLVDAYAAVQLADTWTQSDSAINEVVSSARAYGLQVAIPDGEGAYSKTFHIDSTISVEHVELGIDLRHTRLGDLVIELTSPSGTVTNLMDRPTVNAEQPFGLSGTDSGVPTHLLWDLSSVQFWGEQATGDWTVTVRDVRAEETGTISSLSLRVYGAADSANDTYVFTEEGFKSQSTLTLQDESGTDTVNAAVMLHDMFVDLTNGFIAAEGVTDPIASWTVIENAITGAGNDRLDGNDAANNLQGRDGNDTLQGGLGNDILTGGGGSDTAVFAGAMAEFGFSYDPNSNLVTVVDNLSSNGNEGTDTLSGIERLVFSDGEISLGETVGNHAPVVNRTVFDAPIIVGKGMGIQFDLPDAAFSDQDVGANNGWGNGDQTAPGGSLDNNNAENGSNNPHGLKITAQSEDGGELPSWLTYDPVTRTFSGVPPEGEQGRIKVKVAALDEFGSEASGILTFQLGDNQAPTLDAARELVVNEDAALLNLGISVPVDPEATAVTVTITDIPTLGQVFKADGSALTIGSVLAADQMAELHYQTASDANGNGGYLRFVAKDADGVTAESSIHLFVEPVNDAPRFGANSQLTINYPTQQDVPLDVLVPADPESSISQVTVTELPAMGAVYLSGHALTIGQVLTNAQLANLRFALNENVNGPIGSLGIQAVDPQGLSATWKLALQVQGEAYSTVGTAVADAMYGSISDDTLYGMGGNDTLVGNAGNDRLLGGAGDDTLLGGSGNDALDGSSGNDYLDGGTGNDTMVGGPGNDYYFVNSNSDVVIEALSRGAGGTDTVETSATYLAPANIENLIAQAGALINLTGNELNNQLSGNELGNVLTGGAGADVLLGFGGDDILDGGAGIDKMAGGTGNDLYRVDSRSDLVLEYTNEGIDTVEAASTYTLTANVENLILLEGGDYAGGGNSLANVITGNSGNNLLSGGLGVDTLIGGLGDDTYVLSDLLDSIIDSGGMDTIRTSQSITLQDVIERAELIGLGDTSAVGNAADNTLIGNPGNNYLEGGAGVDVLTGGGGGDGFFIAYNGLGKDADTVTDFKSGEDLLMLDLASFGINPQALGIASSGMVTADFFVTGAGARALDPNDYFIFDTAQQVLYFDPDGSGSKVALAGVHLTGSGALALAADDLYITI